LRAADLVLARRFPADAPGGADDLLQLVAAEGLERILSLPAGSEAAEPAFTPLPGRPAAEVRACPPAPDLAAASLLRGAPDRSAVLYLGSPAAAGPGGTAGWIRLDGASVLGRPQEGLSVVALAPWPAAARRAASCSLIWAAFELLLRLQHPGLGGLKHRIQPPQHTHRQDHIRIPAPLEQIPQHVIGDAPQETHDSVVGGLVHGIWRSGWALEPPRLGRGKPHSQPSSRPFQSSHRRRH
jgi:hypothetical protein